MYELYSITNEIEGIGQPV